MSQVLHVCSSLMWLLLMMLELLSMINRGKKSYALFFYNVYIPVIFFSLCILILFSNGSPS